MSAANPVGPPSTLTGCHDKAVREQGIQRAHHRLRVNLRPDAAVDVDAPRIRKPFQVLEDQRPEPMRLYARERRQAIEPRLAQQAGRDEVARALRAALLLAALPPRSPAAARPTPSRRPTTTAMT
jgi:hypothetical protein